jgi:hypothetical protein
VKDEGEGERERMERERGKERRYKNKKRGLKFTPIVDANFLPGDVA